MLQVGNILGMKKSLSTRKYAFTLAEVLITLAVIGIVASMTIPVVTKAYKKRVIEEKLKVALSTLQNAAKMSVVENGDVSTWDFTTTYPINSPLFISYFKPYLNVIKTCIYTNKTGECRHAFYLPGLRDGTPIEPNTEKYILANGMGVFFGQSGSGLTRKGVFYVDLSNGKGDKLILGKNLFVFNLVVKDNKYSITSVFDYPYPNVNFCTALTRSQLKDYCLNGSGAHGYSSGIHCTAMIECNGWKIPDDYPIDF